MVLDRRSRLAGVLIGLAAIGLAVSGCAASHDSAAQQNGGSASATASAGLPAPNSSAPGAAGSPAASPSYSISVPAYLCLGTDVAQNAADAYMGALSAGNLTQATACVLPRTVPATVTRSLLATSGTTAVYLPRDGVDGPSVFGYRGAGKLVDVTVSKSSDGRFWITRVSVRSS